MRDARVKMLGGISGKIGRKGGARGLGQAGILAEMLVEMGQNALPKFRRAHAGVIGEMARATFFGIERINSCHRHAKARTGGKACDHENAGKADHGQENQRDNRPRRSRLRQGHIGDRRLITRNHRFDELFLADDGLIGNTCQMQADQAHKPDRQSLMDLFHQAARGVTRDKRQWPLFERAAKHHGAGHQNQRQHDEQYDHHRATERIMAEIAGMASGEHVFRASDQYRWAEDKSAKTGKGGTGKAPNDPEKQQIGNCYACDQMDRERIR